MLKKYRRKVVEVEAVQYTKGHACVLVDRINDTFHGHPAQEISDEQGCIYRTGRIRVQNEDGIGSHLAEPGDWLVKDWQGIWRVYKPEQFEADFEPAGEVATP